MSELNNELNENEKIQGNSVSDDSFEGNESELSTVSDQPSAEASAVSGTISETPADAEPANPEPTEAAGAEPEKSEPTEVTAAAEPVKAEAAAENIAANAEAENAGQTDGEKKEKRKKILKICGGVVAAIVAIYCLIAFTYQSKFTTGTIINGIDASGMTLDEYTEALTEKVESYVLTMKFRNKKTEKIKGTDVGYTYVADDGAKKLLEDQNIFAWSRG